MTPLYGDRDPLRTFQNSQIAITPVATVLIRMPTPETRIPAPASRMPRALMIAIVDVKGTPDLYVIEDHAVKPQKALRGGIPGPYLEPLTRTWSHLVGIYCQKLMKSSKNDF